MSKIAKAATRPAKRSAPRTTPAELRTKAVGVAVEAKTPPAAPSQPKGKLGVLVELLRRPQGATVQDLAAATGWQAHSVRGAIAGALKKDRGLNVESIKTNTGRIYRIAEAAA